MFSCTAHRTANDYKDRRIFSYKFGARSSMDTSPTIKLKMSSKKQISTSRNQSSYLTWRTRFAALAPTLTVRARILTLEYTRWARNATVDVAYVPANQRAAALFITRTVNSSVETFATGPFAKMFTIKRGFTRFQAGCEMGLNLFFRREATDYSIEKFN